MWYRSAEAGSASTTPVLRALHPLTGLTCLHLSGLQDAASRWVTGGGGWVCMGVGVRACGQQVVAGCVCGCCQQVGSRWVQGGGRCQGAAPFNPLNMPSMHVPHSHSTVS
jgi:hypothetical protein